MEEDNVPNERTIARERMYNLLKSFEKDDFHLSNFNPEEELQQTFNISTHLFSALKKCHENCIYDVSFKILKHLIENQQCGKKFLWKMFTNFLQKDCAFFLPLLSDFIKIFLKGQRVHHDEMFLFHSVLLLNKEMYDRAHQEARNFNAKESKYEKNFLETAKAASTALLIGYKTILDYKTFHQDDDNMLNITKESFLLLFSRKTFEPLFAEPYIYILMKLELQEEAEAFLEKYVEKDSKGNIGISAALDALNIIKLHIPNASPKLVISFLEMIANRDSGNPKVLDLCQHHLNNLNSGMCSNSEMESDSDAGANSFSTKLDGLNKCLQLMMYFLDVYVKHLPSADIRKGWSVMAEIMRRICEQEPKDCFQTIIDLWHNDRKRWWPFFRLPRSGLLSSLPPDDTEFYSNKGIVCYILESENHPFVVNLMEHQECSLLKSVVEQLRHPKMKFDLHIESLQKANEQVLEEPLVSKPIVPQMAVINPQIEMTPSLSRFSAIDSEAIEMEFEKHILTTKPVKSKKEFKSLSKMHRNTEKLLKLDLTNMISRRYAKRRKISVQKRDLRMTRAKRAATLSVCSVRSLDSLDSSMDESEDDGDDTMTDGTISHDDEKDGASKLCDPKPYQLTERVLKKHRWKIFIKTGRWDSFCVDDGEKSSDEEYAPPFFSDQDSYSDEFENELSKGETNTKTVISNNYPASIPSSYPSISPASSISDGCTPIPQFSNFSGQPRNVIRNEDLGRFVEFDSFSICSNSTTEGIVNNINQVIRKLDVDIHATTGMDHGADEYVVEEDILIPGEALVQSSSQNTILSSKSAPAAGGYAVEEEIGLSEEITASNVNSKGFSRDFEASSPDMFASFSEDEEQGAKKNKECNQNFYEENRKATNSTAIYQKTPFCAVSTSFVVSTPLAVSTPKIALKSKDKKKVVKSKKKRSETIATQNETNEQYAWESCSSRSKQNSKHGASESDEWKMSLINSMLKESLVSRSSTSNLRKLSTVESETFMEAESCNQTDIYNHGIVEETLPSTAISSAKKPNLTKTKRMDSTSTVNGKSLDSLSTLADTEKMGTESDVVAYQLQPCLANSSAKDLNMKKKRNPTMIHHESQAKKSLLSSVSAPNPVNTSLAVPTPKAVHTNEKGNKVNAKSKTPQLRNATHNEINKQSASGSCSSGSKERSKHGVSNVGEWQMSLVDLLLKRSFEESLLNHEKSPSTSLSKHSSAVDTLQPITVKTTGKKFRKETKKLASTSTAKGKSLVDANVVKKSGISLPDVDHQPKPCPVKSVPARKCHIRVRDSDYLSTSENDSDVSAVSNVVPTPLPVSTPMTTRESKDKKVAKSKKKRLRKVSNSRSSRIKQKSKPRASKSDRWDISFVNRVLKDSVKESPVCQGKSSSEMEGKSQDNVSILADAEKMGTESDVIAHQPQLCLPKSSVKESAMKKRKNSTVIHQETPAKKSLLSSVSKTYPVTTPLAVSTPKTVYRNEKRKKVNAKSKTRPLRNATHNETKKQSTSSICSSGNKSKHGVSNVDEWQMSLINVLLKNC